MNDQLKSDNEAADVIALVLLTLTTLSILSGPIALILWWVG